METPRMAGRVVGTGCKTTCHQILTETTAVRTLDLLINTQIWMNTKTFQNDDSTDEQAFNANRIEPNLIRLVKKSIGNVTSTPML